VKSEILIARNISIQLVKKMKPQQHLYSRVFVMINISPKKVEMSYPYKIWHLVKLPMNTRVKVLINIFTLSNPIYNPINKMNDWLVSLQLKE